MNEKDKKILIELWENIKVARKKAKISQFELVEKTWIDRSYISMVERGETNITYLKLKKISDELVMELIK